MAILTSVAQTRRKGWLDALEQFLPTSPPHRDERIGRSQALLLLRCGEEVLDELCARGLPHGGMPPEELYDRSDLTNLALASNSHRSLPELGAAFVARIASAAPEDWVGERTWAMRAALFALHGAECGEDPSWRFRRPTPEDFGGRCFEWGADGDSLIKGPNGLAMAQGPAALSLSGRVRTRGEGRVVRSRTLRELYRETLATMTFRALPTSQELDAEEVVALGAGDCVGLSVLLERECNRAGYHAVARRGYLLGLLGIGEHSWLEVLDEDERVKILDPSLPMVARRAPYATPAFTAFCLGSISNRLLPFDCPVSESIAGHRCGGVWAPSHAIVSVEQVDVGVEQVDGSVRQSDTGAGKLDTTDRGR